MKKFLIASFVGLLIVSALTIVPSAFAGTASEDMADTYQNTQAFDGGPGSTINTSPAAADEAKS